MKLEGSWKEALMTLEEKLIEEFPHSPHLGGVVLPRLEDHLSPGGPLGHCQEEAVLGSWTEGEPGAQVDVRRAAGCDLGVEWGLPEGSQS